MNSYIDGLIDAFPPAFDDEAFQADSAATNQRYQDALDLLYRMGCQYNVKDADMRSLCDHMGVSWEDLQTHKGKPAAH